MRWFQASQAIGNLARFSGAFGNRYALPSGGRASNSRSRCRAGSFNVARNCSKTVTLQVIVLAPASAVPNDGLCDLD
jgi:hypothetical protein